MMKSLNLSRLIPAALALAGMITYSCADFDDMDSGYQADGLSPMDADAIVTVKSTTSGQTYLQLDESTTLEPDGWVNPYKKEVRALVCFSELSGESSFCTKKVKVKQLDSVLTKDASYIDIDDGMSGSSSHAVPVVAVPYSSTDDLMESSDPVEIVANNGAPDWLTLSEDGYFSIHFATYWGGVTSHTVSLYASKSHPDHLYFVHRNNHDYPSTWGDALVAFRIDQLYSGRTDAYGSLDSVTLHWRSFDGEKTMVFKYGPRL